MGSEEYFEFIFFLKINLSKNTYNTYVQMLSGLRIDLYQGWFDFEEVERYKKLLKHFSCVLACLFSHRHVGRPFHSHILFVVCDNFSVEIQTFRWILQRLIEFRHRARHSLHGQLRSVPCVFDSRSDGSSLGGCTWNLQITFKLFENQGRRNVFFR